MDAVHPDKALADTSVAAQRPWQRRPSSYLVLTIATIVCVYGMHEVISLVQRATLPWEALIATTQETCNALEARQPGSTPPPSPYDPQLPTRPPVKQLDVLVALCTMDLPKDDGPVSAAKVAGEVFDTFAALRGVMQRSAANASTWVANRDAPLVDEVPRLHVRVVERTTACSPRETFAIQSVGGNPTSEMWAVFLVLRDGGAAPTCKRDHNRNILCEIGSAAMFERSRHHGATNNCTSTALRQTVASIVASMLGIQNFYDNRVMEAYLRQRQLAACRYVVAGLSGLHAMLQATPSMPVAREIGDGIASALEAMHNLRMVVSSANRIHSYVSDPSLVPQLFLPVEHMAAVHLSFLLPLIVAFLAGVGVVAKEWKLRRRAARYGAGAAAVDGVGPAT